MYTELQIYTNKCLFVDGPQNSCKIIKDKGVFLLECFIQPNRTKNKEMRAKNIETRMISNKTMSCIDHSCPSDKIISYIPATWYILSYYIVSVIEFISQMVSILTCLQQDESGHGTGHERG
jgi:hypothetical protein